MKRRHEGLGPTSIVVQQVTHESMGRCAAGQGGDPGNRESEMKGQADGKDWRTARQERSYSETEERKMRKNLKTIVAIGSVALILAAAGVSCYGTQYTLIFKNNSTNVGDACVYQHDPDMSLQDVMSLAWFAKGAAPTTTLTFKWTIDYCFAWDETGELVPGVIFDASQIWDADLETTNQVTLTMVGDDVYTFTDQKAGKRPGNLYIIGDKTLPIKQAAVGIGMAGAPTHVAPVQPNWEWVYTPKPLYWITFGTFEPGEILDVESISHKAAIHFPPNVYSMTAILNRDNTWTVVETNK
jgi:hypothetical protein